MLKAIDTDSRLGYSKAVRPGDLIFISGQVAWNALRPSRSLPSDDLHRGRWPG